jgi:hypothetical protein
LGLPASAMQIINLTEADSGTRSGIACRARSPT